ncbi:extracellular solute-binding protein [Bacillus sp. UNC41MFS5]|uniref:extracellular solute-binding protein n=1 Tax=Bacillus sp. UNC41MFS5 TaxID=1449046 RepID=UPI0004792FD9|nr:extracellular solute-binding protein [Bacillus sp. UNC41MFS5]
MLGKNFRKSKLMLVTAATALSLVACNSQTSSDSKSSSKDETVQISLYSGGSLNVKDYWETVIPEFEKENPTIDVKLVFLPAGTGGQSTIDRLVAAKKAGKDAEIDVYEGSMADIQVGENEGGIFAKVDEKNIPNLSTIDEKNLQGTNGLAVPYRASSVVLAYNSEKVKDVPNTPDELYEWIHKNPGRFAYNDPSTGGSGQSFVLTTIYNQLPPEAMNNQDPSIMKEWEKGLKILKELAPDVYQKGVYPKKNQGSLDLLANGEIDMTPAWSDMALEQVNKKLLPDKIKLKQLNPAFTGGPAYLMLPENKDKKRKEAAEELLNYVLTPKAQEIVADKMYGYPGIDWDLLPEELQRNFESVKGGYRIFNGGSLSEEINKRWQEEIAAQ